MSKQGVAHWSKARGQYTLLLVGFRGRMEETLMTPTKFHQVLIWRSPDQFLGHGSIVRERLSDIYPVLVALHQQV